MHLEWSLEKQPIEKLVGETLSSVKVSDNSCQVEFKTVSGRTFLMEHIQDCCESVYLEDVYGDWEDLIGSPIVMAEESSSDKCPEGVSFPNPEYPPESYTWTFYELATSKGAVTLRWYGTSNGYYSERVDFGEI